MAPHSKLHVVGTPLPRSSRPDAGGDIDESELIARSREGDMHAWGRLYQVHFDGVYRHVCYLTGDPTASEDLTQETFARALASVGRFEGRSRLSTWLHGIAVNVVRKHRETTRKADVTRERLGTIREAIPQSATLERRHLQRARLSALFRILDTLPDHLREAFVLRDLQGLDVPEAAARLQITDANLRVRAHRARSGQRRVDRRGVDRSPGGQAVSEETMSPALAAFLGDVREGLEERIDSYGAQPDLQDCVVRAHARHGVDAAWVEASRAPELLPPAPTDERSESAQLPEFLDGVVEEIESWHAERKLSAVPSPRAPRRRGVRIAVASAGVLAAAAVIVAMLGGLEGLVAQRNDSARGAAAPMSGDRTEQDSSGEAMSREHAGRSRTTPPRAGSSVEPEPEPEPPPETEPPPEPDAPPGTDASPEPGAQPEPDAPPEPAPASTKTRPHATGPTLSELDASAQAALRAGETERARKLFEELVHRGGKSKYAELAYGDLMTMAHRDGAAKREVKLWRRYLARFPRGRYADDARASLCRAAGTQACWEEYLKDWPRGAHRDEARTHVSDP